MWPGSASCWFSGVEAGHFSCGLFYSFKCFALNTYPYLYPSILLVCIFLGALSKRNSHNNLNLFYLILSILGILGLFLEIRTCMRYNEKVQEKGTMLNSYPRTPNFSKFRAFRMLHPPKRHVVLKGFNRERSVLFIKKGIACGYCMQLVLCVETYPLFHCLHDFCKIWMKQE